MNLTTTTRVGEIAAFHPLTTRVLARHGIDYCCGGGIALEVACERKGLDPNLVLSELRAEVEHHPGRPETWLDAPLADLVDHIITVYHVPLREELPRLEAMARKVATVHADRDHDGSLAEIVATFVPLRAELEEHMAKEEEVLFPRLLGGELGLGTGDKVLVESFVDEHEVAGAALARLRTLTKGFQVPAEACTTWRALWAGLEALETTMFRHVHLENNILFPRAVAEA